MSKYKEWAVQPQDEGRVESLAQQLNVSRLTAHLLLNRGVRDAASARGFLQPSLAGLADPFLVNDMEKAVERIDLAVRQGEKIVVFGDYDVDGITGTALLYRFFRMIKADVSYYIPDRIEEGYSLTTSAVEKFAAGGIKVIITVDSGTSAFEAIRKARDAAIDVIVVDHHEPASELPPAAAIVNPKIARTEGVFRDIAAVGVALKFAWAYAERHGAVIKKSFQFKQFLIDAMALAGVGTIADVAPLSGENRVFAVYGLAAAADSSCVGLRVLVRRAGLEGVKLEPSHVGFRIGPLINASGRIGTAQRCMELFVTDDRNEAESIVDEIERANKERQTIESAILSEARKMAMADSSLSRDSVLVLAGEGWHVGVIGIVASKLVDEFHKPAVVIGIENGTGRGSARSVPGFPLQEAIELCKKERIILHGGGHSMAAGFSIDKDQVPRLRNLMNERAKNIADLGVDLSPQLRIDREVLLSSLKKNIVGEMALLAPFGVGNPSPCILLSNVRLSGEPRLVGKQGNHLRFHIAQGESVMQAVAFNMADLVGKFQSSPNRFDVACQPVINSWNGRETVEVHVKDVRF